MTLYWKSSDTRISRLVYRSLQKSSARPKCAAVASWGDDLLPDLSSHAHPFQQQEQVSGCIRHFALMPKKARLVPRYCKWIFQGRATVYIEYAAFSAMSQNYQFVLLLRGIGVGFPRVVACRLWWFVGFGCFGP